MPSTRSQLLLAEKAYLLGHAPIRGLLLLIRQARRPTDWESLGQGFSCEFPVSSTQHRAPQLETTPYTLL